MVEVDETTAGLTDKPVTRRLRAAGPSYTRVLEELGFQLRRAGHPRPGPDSPGIDLLFVDQIVAGWDRLDLQMRSAAMSSEGRQLFLDGAPCPTFPFGCPTLDDAIALMKAISARRVGWQKARGDRQVADRAQQRTVTSVTVHADGVRMRPGDGATMRAEETMRAGVFRERRADSTMIEQIARAYPAQITPALRDVGLALGELARSAGYVSTAGVSSYGERSAVGSGRGVGIMREGNAAAMSDEMADLHGDLVAELRRIKNPAVLEVVQRVCIADEFDLRIGYLKAGLSQLIGRGAGAPVAPPEWDDREADLPLLVEISPVEEASSQAPAAA